MFGHTNNQQDNTIGPSNDDPSVVNDSQDNQALASTMSSNVDFSNTSIPATDSPILTSPVVNPISDVPPVDNQDQNSPDLLDIKQKALNDLSPLVEHLDQNPLEKFKTTMMMIQASDNKQLLPDAYKAAQQIQDDKAKAQALLDIINEINYFTQSTQ